MTTLRTRRLALVAGALLAPLLAVPLGGTGPATGAVPAEVDRTPAVAAARPAPVQDPDRVSTTPAGWGWHTSVAPSTISSWLSSTGQRITDLEVTSASPLRFSAAYVGNSGTYNRAWWWYYGQTAAQVGQKLSTNGARLTDIEAYNTSDGIRYAVVMVKNTGDAAKAWGWYSSATLAQIGTYASNNNMRVIDSDRFVTGGNTRYTAIFVKNTGVDALSWWHYYGISAASVSARLNDNNARLINLERNTNGTFDVIMTKGGFSGSWWYLTGRTSTQVNDFVNQVGARIFHVDSRVVSGIRYYDVLMLDNTTTETRRIRNLVANKMTANWGFYMKLASPTGAVVAGLNHDRVFEPASMIKITHAVTALRDTMDGSPTVTSNFDWRLHPSAPARYPGDTNYGNDKNVCAYTDGTPVGTTIQDPLGSVILTQMLQQSDNRATDAIVDEYGFTGINAVMDLAGMTRSNLNHRINCGTGGGSNELTLVDAGKIYQGVHRLELLDSARRANLYSYISTRNANQWGSAFTSMVNAELTAAGLTSAERTQFRSLLVTRFKPGGYTNYPTSSTSLIRSTNGGMAVLPVKTRFGLAERPYVWGQFIDATFNCTSTQLNAGTCTSLNNANAGISQAFVEMFRPVVRSAAATW